MIVSKYARGQVWWYENDSDFDNKIRPVIIISNNKANAHSNQLIGIPCSTQTNHLYLPTKVQFSLNGVANVACCERVTLLSLLKMKAYIGVADDELMEKIEEAVQIALGIKECPINNQANLSSKQVLKQPINNLPPEDKKPVKTANNIKEEQPKRQRASRFTIDEKIRFINDCENHDIDYIMNKYKLKDKQEVAKRKYAFKKYIEMNSSKKE